MSATTIEGFVTMGLRGVMDALGPQFEQASGYRLSLAFNPSASLNRRLQAGETADVVIGTRAMIDGLIAGGKVTPGSDVAVAHSTVGVAMCKGARRPDISTADACVRALLAARAIACSDPTGGGASGVHFLELIERLGIAEAMKPKIRLAPVGTFTAALLVSGEAELAVQQISELIVVEGAEVIGPLPGELGETSTFVGAVHAAAKQPQAAQALLDFLRTAEAEAIIKARGLEPA